MKLLIVTVVREFKEEILQLFKEASITNFSESYVDGHHNSQSSLRASDWFSEKTSGVKSILFFSFTKDENMDMIFKLIKGFNEKLETSSPIKAVVVPIEKHN